MSGLTKPVPPIHLFRDEVTASINDAWSIPRLAETLGVSSRTLHRMFRRTYGMSPMSLVRRERLTSARQRLEASSPRTTVTGVALDCGFTHLGRFSQDYARQFGESPSVTLRRARRRDAAVPESASSFSRRGLRESPRTA